MFTNSFVKNGDMVALVPVRAGSKGLANKNIRDLNGQPLFFHAVTQGLRTVGRVLLSTDIAEIAEMSIPEECSVLWRPKSLADDDIAMESVIAHAIDEHNLWGLTIVLLQATTPLRADQDILRAIELFRAGNHDLVMAVTRKDKSVLKFGTLELDRFIPIRKAEDCFTNRQHLPSVYGPNGAVYVFDADEFAVHSQFPSRRIGAIEMPYERSIDIDTEEDWHLVQRLRSIESDDSLVSSVNPNSDFT